MAGRLFQIVDFNRSDAGAAVLPGQDRREGKAIFPHQQVSALHVPNVARQGTTGKMFLSESRGKTNPRVLKKYLASTARPD
jgi:hypothetical protein